MGGCVSSKAGKKGRNSKYTSLPAAPIFSKKQRFIVMDAAPAKQNGAGVTRRAGPYSRGASSLFGFKPARRPASASPMPAAAAAAAAAAVQPRRRTCSRESLHSESPGESPVVSPRAARRADEVKQVKVNRFGFKGTVVSAGTNKVADSNADVLVNVAQNGTAQNGTAQYAQDFRSQAVKEKPRNKGGGGGKIVKPIKAGTPGQGVRSPTQPQPLELGQTARFTLQTSLLPTPQFPIRLASADTEIRSKGAKTMANISTKTQGSDSSSNGSLNADSGIGSQRSADADLLETAMQEIRVLQESPGMANRRNVRQMAMKRRELEVVVTGKSFDVVDIPPARHPRAAPSLDHPPRPLVLPPDVITEISVISLPKVAAKPALKVAPQLKQAQPENRIPRPTSQPAARQTRGRTLLYQRPAPSNEPQPADGFNRNNNNNNNNIANNVPGITDVNQIILMDRQDKPSPRNSGEWGGPAGGEEKAYLDLCGREKGGGGEGGAAEDMDEGYGNWGQGEAMAEEFTATEDGFKISNIQCRPVHLEIEESRFAAIAAGESSLIEDERSPIDSLMSHSLPTSSDNSEGTEKDAEEPKASSPDSPTNASNSLSLSEGRDRDFLIDDEIADQPGLMFDEQVEASDLVSSLGLLEVTESTPTLVETLKAPLEAEESPVAKTPKRRSRAGSVGTLSPCESIASDDLMMDFDRSEESAFNPSRMGSCAGLQNLDSVLSECGSQHDDVVREWASLLDAHHNEDSPGLLSGRSTRLLRSRPTSTPDSPRSLDSRPRPSLGGSPLRPPRRPSGSDSDDGANYMRIDRATYQQMCQDIVSMKTMLLKLKRLFQENEENSLTMAETLNPFDNTLKNGLFYSLSGADADCDSDSTADRSTSTREEVVDLRRQVVFLQQQVDERERTVQLLQLQMTRYTTGAAGAAQAGAAGERDTINAATQTERIRPVSAGPSLLQSLPTEGNMGPLVSLSDGWRPRKTSLTARRLSSPTPQRRTSLSLVSTNLVASTQLSGIPTLKQNGQPRSKS